MLLTPDEITKVILNVPVKDHYQSINRAGAKKLLKVINSKLHSGVSPYILTITKTDWDEICEKVGWRVQGKV